MSTRSEPSRYSFQFLLDADISPEVARIGRALGLDSVSVYECGRGELRDDEQLRWAATDGRIFVTRNRNDFLHWTSEFVRMSEPHAGVLIVSRSIPATRPELLAHALVRWAELIGARFEHQSVGPYFIDFLSAEPGS